MHAHSPFKSHMDVDCVQCVLNIWKCVYAFHWESRTFFQKKSENSKLFQIFFQKSASLSDFTLKSKITEFHRFFRARKNPKIIVIFDSMEKGAEFYVGRLLHISSEFRCYDTDINVECIDIVDWIVWLPLHLNSNVVIIFAVDGKCCWRTSSVSIRFIRFNCYFTLL